MWVKNLDDTIIENPKYDTSPFVATSSLYDNFPSDPLVEIARRNHPELKYVFSEDNVAIDLQEMGDDHGPWHSCELSFELEQIGYHDIFEYDIPTIVKIAELKHSNNDDGNIVRFILLYDARYVGYSSYEGDEHEFECDMIGEVDLNKVRKFAVTPPPPEDPQENKYEQKEETKGA